MLHVFLDFWMDGVLVVCLGGILGLFASAFRGCLSKVLLHFGCFEGLLWVLCVLYAVLFADIAVLSVSCVARRIRVYSLLCLQGETWVGWGALSASSVLAIWL